MSKLNCYKKVDNAHNFLEIWIGILLNIKNAKSNTSQQNEKDFNQVKIATTTPLP